MTIAERHKYILEQLKQTGTVRVVELSDEMNVSVVTIRKDLKVLEDRGILFRSHGSASSRELFIHDRSVNEKQHLFSEEKKQIARTAISFLTSGEAIIIGSGTTAFYFAQFIPEDLELTVLTAAMNVSQALLSKPNIEVVQLGGVVRKNATSVVGPFAEEMLKQFACSKLFLGVDGLSLEFGLTTSNMMEAHLNKAMIKAVQKTIVLCDSSKIERRGFGRICEVEEVDVVISDGGMPEMVVAELEGLGLEVVRD